MQLGILAGFLTLALIAVVAAGSRRRYWCGNLTTDNYRPAHSGDPCQHRNAPSESGFSRSASVMDGHGATLPATLGRYEIIEKVGQGAMGVVFKGRDPRLDRLTAIKTIRFPDGLDDMQIEAARRQLNREAELLAGLTHPNIVTVYDVGEDRGTTFVAMEFLDGERLTAFTQADQLLPVEKVLDIVGQVADALAFAHANGIVHRDIKPGNIVVQDDGSVKVTDFGIALSDIGDQTHTTPLKGSIRYMSPEQVRGEGVTGQSDLFSLGVVMFELLTGRLPFSGENDASIVYQTTTAIAPKVSEIRPELASGLDAIVDRALAKEPADRYPDAETLVGDLIAEMDTDRLMGDAPDSAIGDSVEDLFDDVDFAPPVMAPQEPVESEPPIDPVPHSDGDLDFSDIEDLMRSNPNTVETEAGNIDDLFSDEAESGSMFDTEPMTSDAPRDLFDTVPEEIIDAAPAPLPAAPKPTSAWSGHWQRISQKSRLLSAGGGNAAQFRFVRVLAGCLLVTGIGMAWYAYLSSQVDDPYWQGSGNSLAQYRKTDTQKQPAVAPKTIIPPTQPSAPPSAPPSSDPVPPTSAPSALPVPPVPNPAESTVPATPPSVNPGPEPVATPPPPPPAAKPVTPKPKPVQRRKVTSLPATDSNRKRVAYQKRRQALLDRLVAHVDSGRKQLDAKAYPEARAEYETALTLATMKPYADDPEFFAISAEINAMLARDDLTYGAKGYQNYNGRWLSAMDYENALYADGHIRYKGTFIPYGQFSDHIRRVSHDGARSHLARHFVNRRVHKTQLTYQGMQLLTTDRRGAQVAVRYRWEVWMFQTIDTGDCTVTVEYDSLADRWQAVNVDMPDA